MRVAWHIFNKVFFNTLMLLLLVHNVTLGSTSIAESDKSFFEEDVKILHDFVIIVPSYNNNREYRGEKLYKMNLESIFSQTYSHYKVIYIDDCSTDNTYEGVKKFVNEKGKGDKVILINNTVRKGQLANRYLAGHMCPDRSIIVVLDGDDIFPHENVLAYLNKVYQDENIWMTYGQIQQLCRGCELVGPPTYVKPGRNCKHKKAYGVELPPKVVIDKNEWRNYIIKNRPGGSQWLFAAPKTFYAKLYKQVRLEELMVDGQFYGRGTDVAEIIPMAEMAGHHVKFIPDILYIWTFDDFLQHNKENSAPVFWYSEMKRKPPYSPLVKLFD